MLESILNESSLNESMKVLIVGDPHGDISKIKKSDLKKADLILITGDIGKADLARKQFFENLKRKREGLPELEKDAKFEKKVRMEIYDSTLSIVKELSRYAPVYSILGNVGSTMIQEFERKKVEKKNKIKLPSLRKELDKIENFYLVKNVSRNIGNLRVGFLEHFNDVSWVKEFKPKDYSKELKRAKKESDKAKKVLRNFKNIDVLVCHAPPYGILDEVSGKFGAPKHWWGKHAGSKVILDYVKKYQPKYVFCGHIHEARGMKKIGKSIVYNVGFNGDYVLLDI